MFLLQCCHLYTVRSAPTCLDSQQWHPRRRLSACVEMTSLAPPSPHLCRAKRGRRSAEFDGFSPSGKRHRCHLAADAFDAAGQFWSVRHRLQTLFPDMDEKVRVKLATRSTVSAATAKSACSATLPQLRDVRLSCVKYSRHPISISLVVLQIITSVLESCQGDLDEALEKLTELSLTTNSSPTAEHAGTCDRFRLVMWLEHIRTRAVPVQALRQQGQAEIQ